MLTGTSVAVAAYLRVSTLVVRLSFVVLSLAAGFGVVIYAVTWLAIGHGQRFVPTPRAEAPDAQGGPAARHANDASRNVGFAMIALAVVVAVMAAGWTTAALWPAVIVAVGVAVAWRRSAPAQLAGVRGTTEQEAAGILRSDLWRQAAGLVLVVAGVGVLLFSNFSISVLFEGLVAGLILVTGVALVIGPWVFRSAQSAIEERRERVRSEERAAMAEHLHDSVLQTLTLIQKRSGASPDGEVREISNLARRQERELRRWLYGSANSDGHGTLRGSVESVVADVEDLHTVTIETVVVGDARMTPALEALTGALREALVNAAKFSGRTDPALFVEIADGRTEAFVRDRGVGFDPSEVSEDRHGIRDSILGRVARHGGTATIASSPGEGTEVTMSVPLGDPTPDEAPNPATATGAGHG